MALPPAVHFKAHLPVRGWIASLRSQ